MKMIKIEICFANVQEAADFLAKHAPTTAPIRVTEAGSAAREPLNELGNEVLAGDQQKSKAEAPKAEPAAAASSLKPDEFLAAGETAEVTYDELKKSIMKLVAIDPKHMREIADSFGLKTFQGTTADVWPKAKKAVDDKIAALRS